MSKFEQPNILTMSRLLIPALTLLLGISLNAQPPTWSTETTVANSSFQNLRPRITSNASGEAVVLWGSNATGTNYAAVGGLSGFSTPVSVIPAGLNTWVANWIGSEIDAHNDNVWLTMFGQVNGGLAGVRHRKFGRRIYVGRYDCRKPGFRIVCFAVIQRLQ